MRHRFQFLFILALSLLALASSLNTATLARGGAMVDAAPVSQTQVQLKAVGHFGGWLGALASTNNTLYMGVGAGLRVYDITDPAHPQTLASLPLSGEVVADIVLSDGMVYAVNGDGLRAVDISDPAQPALLGGFDTPGWASGVDAVGNRAYVADGASGLQILDVSDPTAPALLGAYDTPGQAFRVQVVGATAYVADRDGGLQIIDVSNPASPTLLGSYATSRQARDVRVVDGRAYVAAAQAGVLILDVSNPAQPALLGAYDTPGYAQQVLASGAVAYVADGGEGLLILDVSNPAQPTLLGTSENLAANVLALSGDRAYVGSGGELYIVDVSDPANLVALSDREWPAETTDIFIPDTGASVAAVAQNGGPYGYLVNYASLWVMDLANPAAPEFVAHVTLAGSGGQRVTVVGDTAYVVAVNDGLEIYDVSNPLNPTLLGRHLVDPGRTNDVFVVGQYAYLTTYGGYVQGMLRILDVSDPTQPIEVGSLETPGKASQVFVAGDIAYVADKAGGLRLIDVSNPAAPVEVGQFDPPQGAESRAIYVEGNEAYLGSSGDSGAWVQKINVSDPAQPVVMAAYQAPAPASVSDIQVTDEHVYVAAPGGSLWLLSRNYLMMAAKHHSKSGWQIELLHVGGTTYYGYMPGASGGGEIIEIEIGGGGGACSIVAKIKPRKAKTDGSKVIPPQKECQCGVEKVSFSAQPGVGWIFDNFNPEPPMQCPDSGQGEIVATFSPYLTLTGGGGGGLCIKGDETVKTALNFTLSASQADSWAVSSITFRASGNGNDQADIAAVKLYSGGQIGGDQKYDGDDGNVRFSFPKITIPAGGSVGFRLEYEFDFSNMEDCAVATKEYAVSLIAHNSEAENFPPGHTQGSAQGKVELGCVLQPETGQVFASIQEGVDQVASGSPLAVCPGAFTENVRVDKNLKIYSLKSVNDTIVQAQSNDRPVFDLVASAEAGSQSADAGIDHIIIQGLHIRGGSSGVSISANAGGAEIGGENQGEGNIISDYAQAGVSVADGSTDNAILGNLIYNNNSDSALAIDLNGDGFTYNDHDDSDEGANHLQNFPMLKILDNGVISGTINSIPGKTLRVELFLDRQCEPTTPGDAEEFLGSVSVTPGGDFAASFEFTPPKTIQPGQGVVATATDPDGNTSELTPCPENLVFKVDNEGNVFADGSYQSPAADFAELWPVSADATSLQPGDALALGPDGGVVLAGSPDAGSVIGVYAARPGFLANSAQSPIRNPQSTIPVAMVGIVSLRVSAENGAIRPGDLLTLSSTPGVAALARPVSFGGGRFHLPGGFFAKALEPFPSTNDPRLMGENKPSGVTSTGVIRVLLIGP